MEAVNRTKALKWFTLIVVLVYYTVNIVIVTTHHTKRSFLEIIPEIPTHTFVFMTYMAEAFGYAFGIAFILVFFALLFKRARNTKTICTILLIWIGFGSFMRLFYWSIGIGY